MNDETINVLLTSFPGLGLPPTLAIPTRTSTPIADLASDIWARIPADDRSSRLIITTSRNKQLDPSSRAPLSSLVDAEECSSGNDDDDSDESQRKSRDKKAAALLTLRLSAPLCGGKGGFGSQLRAAGGRMASKRRKNAGDPNASARNLDGRRLRTVTEAKALAEYLAVKPEMDRKQKERRRQRWEQVVEAAERREEELRNGAKSKVDGQWVEDRDEAGERTREAVRAAMASGDYRDVVFTTRDEASSGEGGENDDDDEAESDEDDGPASGSAPTSPEDIEAKGKGKGKGKGKEKAAAKEAPRAFFGWDEDDEFMSSDGSSDEDDEHSAGEHAKSAASSSL